MDYPLLKQLVEQEGPATFQRIDQRWRPSDLLMLPQVRLLLRDIERRYDLLAEAEPEFKKLNRSDLYITMVRRMRLWVRRATFTWKSDQLTFIQLVAKFYKDYGQILRLLKYEQLRGRFADPV